MTTETNIDRTLNREFAGYYVTTDGLWIVEECGPAKWIVRHATDRFAYSDYYHTLTAARKSLEAMPESHYLLEYV